jgi:pimeloyl-ACP methyl ester carboxylesterase
MRRRRFIIASGVMGLVLVVLYQSVPVLSTVAIVLDAGDPLRLWHGPIARTTTSFGPYPADVYTSRRSVVPILLIHGVNESGKDGPRIRPFAEGLAAAGFVVILPEFERLTRQNVTPADVDDVVSTFTMLGREAGIACVSYGCGPAVIAASRPEIRDKVRFILTFGAYFDLRTGLAFIVTSRPSPLAYTKWRYMGANVDLLRRESDRMAILRIAAARAGDESVAWAEPSDELSSEGLTYLSVFESVNTAEFESRVGRIPALNKRIEQLSPSRFFEGIRAPMIIVHMKEDPCIPSTESVRMADAASRRGISYRLTLLEGYGHTRPDWPPLGIRSLWRFYLPETRKVLTILNDVLSYAQ